jgi:hypothetical protein
MKILVDTSIWSLAFRRKNELDDGKDGLALRELKELINETRVILIGPIRQEILSGISDAVQFNKLKNKLKVFKDFPIHSADYELAAEFYNTSRKKGVQGSHIDFLICAFAKRNEFTIFTSDNDFQNYSKILDLKLHQPRDFNK